jgi:hypothetical protein
MEEDASDGREGVIKRLYRELPPLRSVAFAPTLPRLTQTTRNYRVVAGSRFALGLLTIDVPHEWYGTAGVGACCVLRCAALYCAALCCSILCHCANLS